MEQKKNGNYLFNIVLNLELILNVVCLAPTYS